MADQPNSAADVHKDQTASGGNVDPSKVTSVTGLPLEDQAVMDLVATSVEPEIVRTEDAPVATTETPVVDTPVDDGKKEVTSEDTPADPFAKLGDKVFQTKEQLVEFASSQVGFNRAVVGNLKKIHPDWFDDKGQLKPDRMSKVKDAQAAVEATPEGGNEQKFNDKEKQKFRDMGFVFKDDIQPLADAAAASDKKELTDWLSKPENKDASQYGSEIVALVEATQNLPTDQQLDVDQAWAIVAGRHSVDITKTAPADTTIPANRTYEDGLRDGAKRSALNGAASPASGAQQAGAAPKKGEESDIMDTILGARTL